MNVGEAGHYYRFTRFRSPDWMVDAACVGVDPDLWFAPTESGFVPDAEGKKAQAICMGCPVARQCLKYALQAEGGVSASYRFGIYGGLTAAARTRLARRGVR